MKAHQLIAVISPALKLEITSYLQKETREAYRTSLYSLAAQRKLRPQYIQAKSREQQGEWLMEQLKLRTNDGVGEQLLQLWLLKAKTPMLVSFLDAAGIKHDGEGQVDDLPDVLTKEQVDAGIDAMLKENPPEHIAVYLRLFQLQRPEGWPTVAEALEKRSELKLG
ncbi:MAG: hypothetical protein RL693_750 [Verrucomicrobiota bacterium]|jgi:hypothetical protein